MLRVDAQRPDPASVAQAVAALRRGELIILPTDTVYGVAADPRLAGAEEKIYRAKARDPRKPIPLLVACMADAESLGAVVSPTARRLAAQFWPGPLTLVLRTGSVFEGYRVPALPVTLAVIRGAGSALRVTSANRSGESDACTATQALAALGDAARLALDAGPSPIGAPSTVVKIEGERWSILREGAIAAPAIRRLLEEHD
jgi:L-threonylcarbamoyladenylate synthase